jgi:hypothetical protein
LFIGRSIADHGEWRHRWRRESRRYSRNAQPNKNLWQLGLAIGPMDDNTFKYG